MQGRLLAVTRDREAERIRRTGGDEVAHLRIGQRRRIEVVAARGDAREHVLRPAGATRIRRRVRGQRALEMIAGDVEPVLLPGHGAGDVMADIVRQTRAGREGRRGITRLAHRDDAFVFVRREVALFRGAAQLALRGLGVPMVARFVRDEARVRLRQQARDLDVERALGQVRQGARAVVEDFVREVRPAGRCRGGRQRGDQRGGQSIPVLHGVSLP